MNRQQLNRLVRDIVDRGVGYFLERPEDFLVLLAVADAALAARLDEADFEPFGKELHDDLLRRRRTDIVHRALFREEPNSEGVWIHCVLEHQSSPDAWMPQRFHHVRDVLWEEERRRWTGLAEPRPRARLSPILPVLFYTGERPWPDPADLGLLVDSPPSLAGYLPHQPILVLDLARQGDPEALLGREHPLDWILAPLCRLHADLDDFLRWFAEAARRLDELLVVDPDRAAAYIEYLRQLGCKAAGSPDVVDETLRGTLVHLNRREFEVMKESYEAVLIQRGIEKGIEKGALEKARRVLLRQLANRFGKLPPTLKDRIASCKDVSILDEWLDRFATASTLEDVRIG